VVSWVRFPPSPFQLSLHRAGFGAIFAAICWLAVLGVSITTIREGAEYEGIRLDDVPRCFRPARIAAVQGRRSARLFIAVALVEAMTTQADQIRPVDSPSRSLRRQRVTATAATRPLIDRAICRGGDQIQRSDPKSPSARPSASLLRLLHRLDSVPTCRSIPPQAGSRSPAISARFTDSHRRSAYESASQTRSACMNGTVSRRRRRRSAPSRASSSSATASTISV